MDTAGRYQEYQVLQMGRFVCVCSASGEMDPILLTVNMPIGYLSLVQQRSKKKWRGEQGIAAQYLKYQKTKDTHVVWSI